MQATLLHEHSNWAACHCLEYAGHVLDGDGLWGDVVVLRRFQRYLHRASVTQASVFHSERRWSSLPASIQHSSSITVRPCHFCSGKFDGFLGQDFMFFGAFWMRYQPRLHNLNECRFVVWLEKETFET
jgi:hypothetical protein